MGKRGLKGNRFIPTLNIKKFRRREKTGGDNGQDALAVLPVEMWTMILTKVEDFNDRWSCYNTCQTWRSIIEPSVYTVGFEKILPGVIKHIDFPTLLVCRQVCKNWCEFVDTLVANSSKLRPFDATQKRDPISSDFYIRPSWDLTSVVKVRKLIQGVRNHSIGRCPIVGRYLQMNYLTDENAVPEDVIQEHHDLSCNLIRAMGQHVYYYSLLYNSSQLTPLRLCQLLRRQLRHLTSLRMLIIGHNSGGLPWTDQDYQALVPYLRGNSLPRCETLDSLVFQTDSIPMLLQHQLAWIHGAQLKYLRIHLDKLTPNLLQRLCSLTELSTFMDSSMDIRVLLRSNAPLQKLTVVFGIGTRLLTRHFLQVVRHFPQLYEIELKLTFNCQLQDDGCRLDDNQMNCYSVKRIYIDFDADRNDWNHIQPRLSFNLLKCFPSIERIHIVHNILCPMLSTIAEVIDHLADGGARGNRYFMEHVLLGGYMQNGLMDKSNVWKLLPKLESFHYQWFDHHHNESGEYYHSRLVYEMSKRRRNKLIRRLGKVIEFLCIRTVGLC